MTRGNNAASFRCIVIRGVPPPLFCGNSLYAGDDIVILLRVWGEPRYVLLASAARVRVVPSRSRYKRTRPRIAVSSRTKKPLGRNSFRQETRYGTVLFVYNVRPHPTLTHLVSRRKRNTYTSAQEGTLNAPVPQAN